MSKEIKEQLTQERGEALRRGIEASNNFALIAKCLKASKIKVANAPQTIGYTGGKSLVHSGPERWVDESLREQIRARLARMVSSEVNGKEGKESGIL